MEGLQAIRTVLISVYNKTGMEPLLEVFRLYSVKLISTGGTATFLRTQGFDVQEVSDLTGFPEIMDGRVKTLHPIVFGGLLGLRNEEKHRNQMAQYGIQPIDCVIVDLYPFHETLKNPSSTAEEIKSQIDIGGVALLRAGAKNHEFVATLSSYHQYAQVAEWLTKGKGILTLVQRKQLASEAMRTTAQYDAEISDWMSGNTLPSYAAGAKFEMRYGENPHQQAAFYGNLSTYFEQLHGKTLSYNNLNDLDAALALIREFQQSSDPVFAILKHTQSCGLAAGNSLLEAWERCLACDPTSAFGGVIVCNQSIDFITASQISGIFFEVLIAPDYSEEALALLKEKKNRIILKDTGVELPNIQSKSLLGGQLVQESDLKKNTSAEYKIVSGSVDVANVDIAFADIAVKHLKSNAIALVKNRQLIGAGSGQTSRVDAVHQAIAKAKQQGFETKGSVLSSDAFFPFPDNLELALQAGVGVVVQPGGSVKDEENIQFCQKNGLAMVLTGVRHFKH